MGSRVFLSPSLSSRKQSARSVLKPTGLIVFTNHRSWETGYFLYITVSTACNVRFTLGKIASIKVGA